MAMDLKITYHPTKDEKWSYYGNGNLYFSILKSRIEDRFFAEGTMPRCELRVYWIDSDNDFIEITNDQDYNQFEYKNQSKRHIHVAPVTPTNGAKAAPDQENNTSQANEAQQKFSHKGVVCDGCLVQPIIGFRYKCLQCPDYDLCERCETQHSHAEHVMMRIPSAVPFLFESSASNNRSDGRRHSGHRHKRLSKTTPCPFAAFTPHFANAHANGLISNVMQNLMGKYTNTAETAGATEAASSETTESRPLSEKQPESVAEKEKPQAEGTACENTVPAPSPTPDSSTDSKPKKKASSEKCPLTPDEIVDILPTLDPQYIKAGIKILSNFNEMFAKIFDPKEGVYAGSSPAKESASVKKNANLAAAQPTPTKEEAKDPPAKEQSIEVLGAAEDQAQAEASISKLTSISSVGSDGRSSQTEETDWQLLDKPHASLSTSIASAGARSIEEVNIVASTDAGATNAVGAAPDITKNTITVTPTPPPPNNRPVEVVEMEPPMGTTYHPVTHVNNSILTMMEMGFSNEGGWLTRLMESVNGNIPDALDQIPSSRA